LISPASPIGRLCLGKAQRPAVFVSAHTPSVSCAGVVQRQSSIGASAVEEFVVAQEEVTAGCGHVIARADSDTLAIVVAACVAGSLQAGRRAGRQDASTVDDTLDVSRNPPPAIPILRFLPQGISSYAQRLSIFVVGSGPSVGHYCAAQGHAAGLGAGVKALVVGEREAAVTGGL